MGVIILLQVKKLRSIFKYEFIPYVNTKYIFIIGKNKFD